MRKQQNKSCGDSENREITSKLSEGMSGLRKGFLKEILLELNE